MAMTEKYLAALIPLAAAFEAYARATGDVAVLVGGAATAIYTEGLFPSGDFDVIATRDDAFDQAMLSAGFVREHRPGRLLVGFYHPDHLAFGCQQVTGPLFDGRSDRRRLVRVIVKEGVPPVVLPAIEDMIVDRLAQHMVSSPTDDSRLRQARTLLDMAEHIDMPYLLRRIRDEQGDPSLLGL